VRPFLEPLRQAAGEVFRSDFSLSPSPTPSPPNYLPAGKEQAFLSSKHTLSPQTKPSSFQQPSRKDEQNHEHRHRPRYYAIKTRHFSFPAGIAVYSHEPYTLQNTLEYGGKFFVCGTGRQPILRNKMENDNYYLLTLAAIAKEIKQRGEKAECSVNLAAGLPLAGFGREKKPFREYLLRSSQPVCFKFEGIPYKVTIEDVKLFPQGYSAIAIHPELIQNEPSVLLMDIGGWTVDLMRLDNGVPNASTCRSLELGMIRCIDETKEQIRRDIGMSVTDAK
jgi:plasmid segregation protein ParM